MLGTAWRATSPAPPHSSEVEPGGTGGGLGGGEGLGLGGGLGAGLGGGLGAGLGGEGLGGLGDGLGRRGGCGGQAVARVSGLPCTFGYELAPV